MHSVSRSATPSSTGRNNVRPLPSGPTMSLDRYLARCPTTPPRLPETSRAAAPALTRSGTVRTTMAARPPRTPDEGHGARALSLPRRTVAHRRGLPQPRQTSPRADPCPDGRGSRLILERCRRCATRSEVLGLPMTLAYADAACSAATRRPARKPARSGRASSWRAAPSCPTHLLRAGVAVSCQRAAGLGALPEQFGYFSKLRAALVPMVLHYAMRAVLAARQGGALRQEMLRGGQHHGQRVLRHRLGVGAAIAGHRHPGRQLARRGRP